MEKYLSSEDDWDDVCDSLEDLGTHASELQEMLEDALGDLNEEICGLRRQLSRNCRETGHGYSVKARFTCNYLPEKGMEPWEGTVDPLLPFDPTDFEVCARGSMFHMVMGHHSSGQYLCIPNWGIGIDIVDPDDCFWNYENLRNAYPNLKKVDAISIVNAMVAIKHYDEISNL